MQVKIIGVRNEPYRKIISVQCGDKTEKYILNGFKGFFEAELHTPARKKRERITIVGKE